MKTRLTLMGVALFACAPSSASAQDPTWFTAASVRPRFESAPSIGPDSMALKYEFSDRWRASVGGEIALVGAEAPSFGALALTLGGVLELSNEDTAAPVPYQMLRAVIGLGVRYAILRQTIDAQHAYRFSFSLAYTHESDHPSGNSNTAAFLERTVALDDFSSFEHLRLVALYEHFFEDWMTVGAAVGLRAYTPPINPFAGRGQQVAFEVELRARMRIHEALSGYAAFYAEGVGHELDPARIGLASLPSLFHVVRLEGGFTLASEEVGRLDLYTFVVDENGRGIDFWVHYGPAFGAGLRGSL